MTNQISQKVIIELDQLSTQLGTHQFPLKNIEKEQLDKILSCLPAEIILFFLQATSENGRPGLLNELGSHQKARLPEIFIKAFLYDELLSSNTETFELNQSGYKS